MNARQRRKVRRLAGQPWTALRRDSARCVTVFRTRHGEEFVITDLARCVTPLCQLARVVLIGRFAMAMVEQNGGVS